MTDANRASCRIEVFDPDRHDRAGFSPGVAAVDNVFTRTASKLTNADNRRTTVLVGTRCEIIGFQALKRAFYRLLRSAFVFCPDPAGPRPDPGCLHRHDRNRSALSRKGGGALLVDCWVKAKRASQALGIAVVLLDILDAACRVWPSAANASMRAIVSRRCRRHRFECSCQWRPCAR
ncbi:hypothetical protein [Sphingomonas crocodyli]|uniref:hypothetical protein n=1 Tax=Sphingomonas crocodyli TaxID=1979270 RepID=UPI001F0BC81C|nr:hypothetical protein [Sphingomonas crocodyli]